MYASGGRHVQIWLAGRAGAECCSSFRCDMRTSAPSRIALPEIAAAFAVLALCACTTYTPPANGSADSARAIPAESSASHYIDGGDSLRIIAHDENLPPGFPL